MPESPPSLDEWVAQLVDALEVSPTSVDIAVILDLARDAAHGVARPAAPLTTFLVGLAAGRAGATEADVAAAIATVMTRLESL